MRKNIIKYGSQEDIDKIIELATKLNLYIFISNGVLLKNYFIRNENKINIGKVTRKNIVIKENYLNEWSSNYRIILTDKNFDFSNEKDFEKIII